MRRFAFVALVAAAACGEVSRVDPGPADRFYRPTGIGVHAGKLVVASSNSDLRYDDETGGTVIAVDPSVQPVSLAGTLAIASFAGQMAIADPATCPIADPAAGAMALVPVRGADQLYRIRIGAGGALSCDGCAVSVGTTQVADPFSVGLACRPGLARAYVGYLRSTLGQTYLTQVDLTKGPSDAGAVQTRALPSTFGQVRSFAFDEARSRLYFTHTVSGPTTFLEWLDLADGCELVPPEGGTPCGFGATAPDAVPRGLELRSIALASSSSPAAGRAYLTARIYDPDAAAAAGVRVGDFDGVLLVVDLAEDLLGELQLRIVRQISIGYGAGDVVRLPGDPAGAGPRRDVVAALAADDGVLWIYDDETGDVASFGRGELGKPQVGRAPFGLAVDPAPEPGATAARLYVGSFEESFVTRIDVPFASPAAASIVGQITGGGTP